MKPIMRAIRSGSGKEVLGTTFWSVLGLFVALLCGVVTARMLVPDHRGVLALLITTVTIVSLVSGVGTNISVRVLLPRDSRVTLRVYAVTTLWLAGVQILVLICVAFLMVKLFGLDLNLAQLVLALVPLGIGAFFANQVSDALSAVGYPSKASLANTVGFGVTASLLLCFWLLGFELYHAVLAYTAGFLTRSVLGIKMIDAAHFSKSGSPEPGGARVLLRQGAGLMGMNLGQSVAYRLDQYLLAVFADTRAVGLYAVATTPASLIQVVSNSIGQVAFRDAAQGQVTPRKLAVFTGLAAGATAVYAGLLSLAAPWLIPFVFGSDYVMAVDIVRVLVVAEIALSPYLVLSRAVAGAGHIKLSSWTGIVGLLAMAAFLVLIVPGNGGIGAAWACVAGYGTMSGFLAAGMLAIRWKKNSQEAGWPGDSAEEPAEPAERGRPGVQTSA